MTPEEAALAGGLAGGIIAMCVLSIVAIYVIFIIAWWKIFKKAGLAGWKSIIPIYNLYCLFRISGMSGWWFILPFASLVLMLCGSTYTFDAATNTTTVTDAGPLAIVGLIGTLVACVVEIIQIVKLSGNFGKGTLFKVLSVFFTPITTLILAFGPAKYDKKALHK